MSRYLKIKKERSIEMKTKRTTTIVITIVILLIGFVISVITNLFFGIAVVLAFLLQGLRRIENDPPHKGIVTILGKRQYKERNGEKITVYTNEGWQFFPFCPFVTSPIHIDVSRKNFQIEVITRTPDRALVKIMVDVTVRPWAERLIEYLDSGEFEGVKSQFSGEISERIRGWVEGEEEGPKNWHELYQARLEAISILVKRIAGKKKMDELAKIPPKAQRVPTSILLKFYSKERPEGQVWPNEHFFENEKIWADEDWEKVREVISPLNEVEKKEVKEAVGKRRSVINNLRSGDTKIELDDLGVILERLNVSNIEVLGKTAEAADQEAKEKEERAAEAEEISHIRKQIEILSGAPLNYSPEQALEILQTERGKVNKSIDEKKLNISPESRQLFEKLGKETLDMIFNKKGGK